MPEGAGKEGLLECRVTRAVLGVGITEMKGEINALDWDVPSLTLRGAFHLCGAVH